MKYLTDHLYLICSDVISLQWKVSDMPPPKHPLPILTVPCRTKGGRLRSTAQSDLTVQRGEPGIHGVIILRSLLMEKSNTNSKSDQT